MTEKLGAMDVAKAHAAVAKRERTIAKLTPTISTNQPPYKNLPAALAMATAAVSWEVSAKLAFVEWMMAGSMAV
jgi:hypothetical protein